MPASKRFAVSDGTALKNMVGDKAATNSSAVPSARTSAWRRRCSAASAGSDPAQPA